MNEQPRKSPEPAPEVGPEVPGSRLLTMPEVAELLGVSERAARDWVKRHDLPTIGSRPVRFTEAAVRLAMVVEGRIPRKSPEVGPEVFGSAPEVPGSGEPTEAAYQVTPDMVAQAIARTGEQYTADLRAMMQEMRQAYELQTIAQRETITELRHRVREKDEVMASQAGAMAALQESLKAERLRAARAEAQAELAERFYDPGRWGEQRRQQYHQAREVAEEAEDRAEQEAPLGEPSPGLWGRLGRWWRGGVG